MTLPFAQLLYMIVEILTFTSSRRTVFYFKEIMQAQKQEEKPTNSSNGTNEEPFGFSNPPKLCDKFKQLPSFFNTHLDEITVI